MMEGYFKTVDYVSRIVQRNRITVGEGSDSAQISRAIMASLLKAHVIHIEEPQQFYGMRYQRQLFELTTKLPFHDTFLEFMTPIEVHYAGTRRVLTSILLGDPESQVGDFVRRIKPAGKTFLAYLQFEDGEPEFLMFDPSLLPGFVRAIPSECSACDSCAQNIGKGSCYLNLRENDDGHCPYRTVSLALMNLVINLINFITATNVKLEATQGSWSDKKAASKRSDSKRGIYLPSDFYTVRVHAPRREYEPKEGSGEPKRRAPRLHWVRGHFMVFTKGKMAGRTLWCPPHQRGKGIYVPKSYTA